MLGHTLNGALEIFLTAFLGDRRRAWLGLLTGDSE